MSAADLTTKVQAAAFAKRTATITTSAEGVTSSGVVRYGKTVEMSLTMSNGAQKMKMIMVGGAFYLDLGEKMQGKTWLRVDEKGKDPLSKAMGPLLATIRQQLNLSASASAFRGVTATSVAGATIDGASTVGYVVKLNSQQIIAALPADVRKSMASPMAGATSVSTYYVDPEWLPRKIVIVTTVKGKKTPMSVMYSNWGDPVTITAPPASDVATGMS